MLHCIQASMVLILLMAVLAACSSQVGQANLAGAASQATPTSVPPSHGNLPETPASPLLSGTGVLHIQATQVLLTEKGEEVERYQLQFWFDRANGDARYEARDVSGTDRQILLREGQTYSVYFPDREYVNSHTESPENGPAAMPKPVGEMFSEKMALDGSATARYPGTKLVAVAEEAIDGKPALVAAPEVAADPAKDTSQVKFRAYIDKATGLTLKVIGVEYTTRDRAGVNGTRLFQYDVIERMDRDVLPQDWFSVRALTPAARQGTATG
ncbi:MAG: hypothetical protein M3Q29_12020 [Chloroflexota bacterium]|nr:hypothetical protein [Chloroflexota bacterium]